MFTSADMTQCLVFHEKKALQYIFKCLKVYLEKLKNIYFLIYSFVQFLKKMASVNLGFFYFRDCLCRQLTFYF